MAVVPSDCYLCGTKMREGDLRLVTSVTGADGGPITFCELCSATWSATELLAKQQPDPVVRDVAAMLNVVLDRIGRVERKVEQGRPRGWLERVWGWIERMDGDA